jgi:hypothetical protein
MSDAGQREWRFYLEFLLKFEKDRMRWRHWLFEAKKR